MVTLKVNSSFYSFFRNQCVCSLCSLHGTVFMFPRKIYFSSVQTFLKLIFGSGELQILVNTWRKPQKLFKNVKKKNIILILPNQMFCDRLFDEQFWLIQNQVRSSIKGCKKTTKLYKKFKKVFFKSIYINYSNRECTVLKSRTFSVVNHWVLRGQCDSSRIFWNFFMITFGPFFFSLVNKKTLVIFRILSCVNCGQFWYFGTLSGVNCGQLLYFATLSGVNCQ